MSTRTNKNLSGIPTEALVTMLKLNRSRTDSRLKNLNERDDKKSQVKLMAMADELNTEKLKGYIEAEVTRLNKMYALPCWGKEDNSDEAKAQTRQKIAELIDAAPGVIITGNFADPRQPSFNVYQYVRLCERIWWRGTAEQRAKIEPEKAAAAPKAQKKTEPVEDTWTCSCGAVNKNSFNFCPVCSAKRPEPKIVVPETWTCSCGAVNESSFNFCPVCSAKRPEQKVVEAPKAEAPKTAAKSTRKSTKATRSSKATKPAVPEEKVEFDAPTLFDMSDAYGEGSFGTVDLEEQRKLKRIDDTLREFVDALLEGASISGKIKAYKIVLAAGKEALDENAAKVNAKATTADKNYNKK